MGIVVLEVTMSLGLKLVHMCDAISVVAEFMVDVAGAEDRPYLWSHTISLVGPSPTISTMTQH